MHFGVSYYPELVPETEWGRDLDMMRDNGLTVVRCAEFAWSALELREDEHTFEWLDRFIAECRRRDMRVILSTPTAAPPQWMFAAYPAITVQTRDGHHMPAGERRVACVNNPMYRHFCAQIAARMAARYGRESTVIGWQIDNELIGPERREFFECHCPTCTFLFREWLKLRYDNLDAVNRAWFLHFWSGAYGCWGEVSTPRCHRAPKGLVIDFFRFYNDSQVEFLKLQYHAMRPLVSQTQFISHNSTGIFDRAINHRDFARVLDETGWDAYEGAAAAGHPMKHPFTGAGHDMFRSALMKPFWIFETNTDADINAATLAEMCARGTRGIIFWHWRRHRGNEEQTAPAFIGHDGRPNTARLRVVRETIAALRQTPELPASLSPRAAAIFFSADNVRSAHRDATRPIPHLDAFVRAYFPAWRRGVGMDVLNPGDAPHGYKLVVLPGLQLLNAGDAALLAEYVRQGGVMVALAPTAHHDAHDVCHAPPGKPLAEVLGFALEDDEPSRPPCAVVMDGVEYAVKNPCEVITNHTAEVLGNFTNGRPAVLRHTFGRGCAYYIACRCEALIDRVMTLAFATANLDFVDHPHPDVTVIPHLTDNGKTWLVNHGNEPRELLAHTVPPHNFVLTEKRGITSATQSEAPTTMSPPYPAQRRGQ